MRAGGRRTTPTYGLRPPDGLGTKHQVDLADGDTLSDPLTPSVAPPLLVPVRWRRWRARIYYCGKQRHIGGFLAYLSASGLSGDPLQRHMWQTHPQASGSPTPDCLPFSCRICNYATGRYTDAVSAARAYDKAAVYLYGDNAITNFGLQSVQADPSQVCCHQSISALSASTAQLASFFWQLWFLQSLSAVCCLALT